MEVIRRKKGYKKAAKKKEGKQFVVHFPDVVDYTEVASILIQHLEVAFMQSAAIALHYADERLNPVTLGEELSLIFLPEDVQELMSISQGPGILLGMYLAKKEFENVGEESEDLL